MSAVRLPSPNRTCQVCEKPFYASPGHVAQGWGKYCSKACNAVAQRGEGNARWSADGEAKCAHCGKAFHRKPTHLGSAAKTFCSQACKLAAYPEKVARNCRHCGKAMTVFACQAERGGVFCSRACGGAAANRKITLQCQKCGKDFKRKRSVLNHKPGAGAFCSLDCKAAWMSGSQLTTSGINRNSARRGGKREDLQGRYFRSSWEANYARYLNWLREKGQIARWEFEPDTFEFPVKRGSKFYTPDFKVFALDNSFEYHEVKGYMDQQSATKLKRMRIHHPSVTVRVIGRLEYFAIAKTFAGILPDWERTKRGAAA